MNDEFIKNIVHKWENTNIHGFERKMEDIINEIKNNSKYKNVIKKGPIAIDGVCESIGESVSKIGSKIPSIELDNMFPSLDKLLHICEDRTTEDIDKGFYFMSANAYMVSEKTMEVYFISHYQKPNVGNIRKKINWLFELNNEEKFMFIYWKIIIDIY